MYILWGKVCRYTQKRILCMLCSTISAASHSAPLPHPALSPAGDTMTSKDGARLAACSQDPRASGKISGLQGKQPNFLPAPHHTPKHHQSRTTTHLTGIRTGIDITMPRNASRATRADTLQPKRAYLAQLSHTPGPARFQKNVPRRCRPLPNANCKTFHLLCREVLLTTPPAHRSPRGPFLRLPASPTRSAVPNHT